MLFNSLDFLVFFTLVVLVYFALPKRFQWLWLLGASVYFYMSYTPRYILLLLVIALTVYLSALMIERYREKQLRLARLYLLVGILVPLAILFIFKYFDFFSQTANELARLLHLHYSPKILHLLLPVGLSFYTFQGLGYVVDVYRGQYKAERNPGIFALFMSFFPQVLMGPIARANQLIPQLREEHRFDYERITDGLKLIAWGFFKKLVIADRAAVMVNEVYNHPHDYFGIYLIVASVLFSIQVYNDFSGYSDIAIGTARILGIQLMENFRRPYLSTNINELWGRWHISLITWLRDYVYIPLGGNRVSGIRWQVNMVIVFVISGIWHGANWTYIFWALLNVMYILVAIWTKDIRAIVTRTIGLTKVPRFHHVLKVLITFILFTIAAVFFRANNISDAFYIITHSHIGLLDLMKSLVSFDLISVKNQLIIPSKNVIFGYSKPTFFAEATILILAVAMLLGVYIFQEKRQLGALIKKQPIGFRWMLYLALVYIIVFYGMFSNQQFLYFIH